MVPDIHQLRIARKEPDEKPQKVGSSKKSVYLVIGMVILMGLGAISYLASRKEPIKVTVETVHAEGSSSVSGETILNAAGYIVAAHKIDVATQVDGRVAWIGVDKGDAARQGQVLVKLESADYLAKVQEEEGQVTYYKAKLDELLHGSRPQEVAKAKSDMMEAHVELENTRVALQRTQALAEARVVSRQALDDARDKLSELEERYQSFERTYDLVRTGTRPEEIDAARGQLQQAEGALGFARAQFADTVIRAPISGTILERNVEPGEYVTTGFASDNGARGYVVSLADLHQLQVDLDINQSDFARLSGSQHCIVATDAYPDRHYDGMIAEISPVANRQKATVEVKVQIQKPDQYLRPDMNATVAFQATDKQRGKMESLPLLSIPKSAMRNAGVFVVRGRVVKFQRVNTVGGSSDRVGISGGIAEGDRVVLNPPADLKDGQKITVEGEE